MVRDFRGGAVKKSEVDAFCEEVILGRQLFSSPVHAVGREKTAHFLHICSGEVVLAAGTRDNVNAVLAFKLLYKINELLLGYGLGRGGGGAGAGASPSGGTGTKCGSAGAAVAAL